MKHLKSFKLFESVEDEVLTDKLVDMFGEFPEIEDVVKYCYDNFEKITGLPEAERDIVEKEFPFIIKNAIDFFDLDETDFIDTWEMYIQDLAKEANDERIYDENIRRGAALNLELRDLEKELIDLNNQYEQLMFDMEQEAEPEGGPIADDYSTKMEDLEQQIANVKTSIKDLKSRIRR